MVFSRSTKQLAAISKLAFEVISQDPARPEYRQGGTLGEEHKHWFRAKFFQQYRLFFRFHARARVIVFACVNDEDTKRAHDSADDAYRVSRRMMLSRSLARPGAGVSRRRNDPTAPVHGPFSADFRLVYLDDEDADPIHCSKAQADVFRAFGEFEGKDRRAEDVMQRAGRRSSKPIDVFKAHPEPRRAYEALVDTDQKEGLYRMPLAAR